MYENEWGLFCHHGAHGAGESGWIFDWQSGDEARLLIEQVGVFFEGVVVLGFVELFELA